MKPTSQPRVKVCCISSIDEAWMAIDSGASALGLVSEMPSGPGVISEELIKRIASEVPPGVTTFLLTSKQSAREIIAQHAKCRTNCIQLVDEIQLTEYPILRAELPGIYLVQVVHVMDEKSISTAETVAPFVDAILLDSGNPHLKVKELGGTGRVHNWTISRQIRERIDKPMFLAGGIRVENVQEAIKMVKPFGIDICSGVRSDGKLQKHKLASLFESLTIGKELA